MAHTVRLYMYTCLSMTLHIYQGVTMVKERWVQLQLNVSVWLWKRKEMKPIPIYIHFEDVAIGVVAIGVQYGDLVVSSRAVWLFSSGARIPQQKSPSVDTLGWVRYWPRVFWNIVDMSSYRRGAESAMAYHTVSYHALLQIPFLSSLPYWPSISPSPHVSTSSQRPPDTLITATQTFSSWIPQSW